MDLGSFFKVLDCSVVPVVELGLCCYSARPQVEPKRPIARAVLYPTENKLYQLSCLVYLQSFGAVACSACMKRGNWVMNVNVSGERVRETVVVWLGRVRVTCCDITTLPGKEYLGPCHLLARHGCSEWIRGLRFFIGFSNANSEWQD
jgi:hypothetical protein